MNTHNDFKMHATDTGSTAVQIELLTHKMAELAAHCSKNPKDHSSKRGMLALVNQRRSLLKYLQKNSSEQYKSLIAKLNLRK